MRKNLLLLMGGVSCISTINSSCITEKERPNILFIVVEDASQDLGCYGNKVVHTPNIDNLAKEGSRFVNAYATYSVSSPSRGSIFTGLYPHQNGQMGLATHKYEMFPGMKTLPVYMKELGYRTGCLGKIHVNPEKNVPFDYWEIRSANFEKKGLHRYAEKAKEFIESSDEPFYLQVNFPDSHFPIQKQVEGRPKVVVEPDDVTQEIPFIGVSSDHIRLNTANYYNCMNRLDESVGMLLEALEKTGKADNTIIFFISDHGAQFSRGKCSSYEGGLKIPFIVKGMKGIKAGETREELVSTLDLLPTFITLAGGKPAEILEGKSLEAIWDKEKSWNREYLFAGGLGATPAMTYPRRSVRDERFKLIINEYSPRENPHYEFYKAATGHFAGGTQPEELENASETVRKAYDRWKCPPKYELYDLQNDPYEWNDLSGNPAYGEIFERLKKVLYEWRVESGDLIVNQNILNMFRTDMDSILNNNINYRKDKNFHYPYLKYMNPHINNKK